MNYDDMIRLPHHVSKKRQQMSMRDRAAQFSPFAALTGYDEEIDEAARIVDEKSELTPEQTEDLNKKLQILSDTESQRPAVNIIHFIKDKSKNGGCYSVYSGRLRFFDESELVLHFVDGSRIAVDDIYRILII